MKPQIIRFVLPSKKDSPGYNIVQATPTFQAIRPVVYPQKAFSVQLVNGAVHPTSTVAPSRLIITSTTPTVNLYNEVAAQKNDNSSTNCRIPEEILNTSTSSVLGKAIEHTYVDESAMLYGTKRVSNASCDEPTQQNTKWLNKKLKLIKERNGKLVKRGKNWSEEETRTFIAVWTDYHASLIANKSKHVFIHKSMAEELNKILPHRSLEGSDVKSKIGNLSMEYRRKKKELGRTGASPPTWPFYDLVDKILGERPYNDDSLLTDSMHTEDEEVSETAANTIADLNSTQISEPANDLVSPLVNNRETNSSTDANSTNSANCSNVDAVSKPDASPVSNSSKLRRSASVLKKRASERKVDLMQQLVQKIESATENASRSEIKVIELLEKQTQLQQESMQNEREFLCVFKTLISNMTVSS